MGKTHPCPLFNIKKFFQKIRTNECQKYLKSRSENRLLIQTYFNTKMPD